MTFALVFLIVLSLILLVGAYLIWKSDLPENDKIISIIAILALFALVSVVNESKKSPYTDVKYNIVEFERSFFSSKSQDIEREYRLPILNDVQEWIESSLDENQLYDSKSYLFGLVLGEARIGKSTAFQEYTKLLQGKTVPALYVNIKDPESNIFNLLTYLKIGTLNLLEDSIDHLNDAGKVPVLIIDNIQNAFYTTARERETSNCPICEYLKILYDSKKINILMITNQYEILPKFASNEAYSLRLNIIYMKPRNNEKIEDYLIQKVNYGINQDKNKFTKQNIEIMLKLIGFYWDQLNEYIMNQENYENIEDFSRKALLDKGYKYISNGDTKQILEVLVNNIQTKDKKIFSNDQWVSYSQIKKYITKDLAIKIKEALRLRAIIVEDTKYKFASQHALNAILVALDNSFTNRFALRDVSNNKSKSLLVFNNPGKFAIDHQQTSQINKNSNINLHPNGNSSVAKLTYQGNCSLDYEGSDMYKNTDQLRSPKLNDIFNRGNSLSELASHMNPFNESSLGFIKSPNMNLNRNDMWASYSKNHLLTPQQNLNDERRKGERRMSELIKPEIKFGESYVINDKYLIDKDYEKLINDCCDKPYDKHDFVTMTEDLGIDIDQKEYDTNDEIYNIFSEFYIDLSPYEDYLENENILQNKFNEKCIEYVECELNASPFEKFEKYEDFLL